MTVTVCDICEKEVPGSIRMDIPNMSAPKMDVCRDCFENKLAPVFGEAYRARLLAALKLTM